MVVCRIQIDEPGHPLGIRARERRELVARDGVANEGDTRESQRIQNGAQIGNPAGQIITRVRLARRAVATARNREDMVSVDEVRGEIIESVSHILQSGEEDERGSRAAPIEHLEAHAGRHGHEADAV